MTTERQRTDIGTPVVDQAGVSDLVSQGEATPSTEDKLIPESRLRNYMSSSDRRIAEAQHRAQQAEEQAAQLNDRLAQLEQTQAYASQRQLEDSDPDEAVRQRVRNLENLLVAERRQRAEAQRDAQLRERANTEREAAVARHVEQGVPREVLDDSSPEALKASAERYLTQKELREVRAELKQLREQSTQGVKEAERRTRAELGATRVSTATTGGRSPSELEEIEQKLQSGRRRRGEGQTISLLRRREELLRPQT